MDAFATKEQMAERSQGAIPADTPFLDTAIGAATRKIRNYCGWHIATLEQTTGRLKPFNRFQRNVILPSLQIKTLDEVTVDGYAADVSSFDFDPDTGESSITGARVVVKMTHGFEQVPEDLVDLTLMMASRALGAPLGYTREQSGQRSVTHSLTAAGVAGGTVILDHERDELATYRLVTL
jgi:hypothetical protein